MYTKPWANHIFQYNTLVTNLQGQHGYYHVTEKEAYQSHLA